MKSVKGAFMHHAQTLMRTNCWKLNVELELSTAQTLKRTMACAVVLF